MGNGRILYADNDRNYLDTRCEFLERKDYQVIKAYNPEDAERALERKNIHLAILDIRMVDDNDEGDISGILLAKDERYKRIPKIFVTGFPTFEAVREAYGQVIGGEPIAHAFLSKKEGPEAMIDAVNAAFEKVLGINWGLRIVPDEMGLLSSPSLALLLDSELDPGLLNPRSSELGDLFRKLFSVDEQISLVRLNWQQGGCACLTLYALSQGSSWQAVVVFGSWQAVHEQHLRAVQYLEVESTIYAKPVFAETLHYAGVAYGIPDAGSGPLQISLAFFQEASDKNVRAALENLYKHSLHNWHKHESSQTDGVDLAGIYRDRLGIQGGREAFDEARRKAQALAGRATTHRLVKDISWEGHKIEFVFNNGEIFRGPDPLAALFDPGAFRPQAATIGTTFGGITARSLLIDPQGRVYPTDMSIITQSPVMEDFISIESELHFEGISSSNLLTLWDYAKQLSESSALNDLPPVSDVEPECRKTLAAIQTIRKLAAELVGDSLESYLIGLFHYTLKGLLIYDHQFYLPKHQAAQLIHRLLAASLILAQIEKQRGEEGKSGGSTGEGNELRINEASRKATIDGREVKLTPTQFKLLLYLYKNPSRLCSREEILSQVFEIKRTPTKADKSLLNTHIDRLRKKIDLNPAKHRYIVTIRGEGYLFDLKL